MSTDLNSVPIPTISNITLKALLMFLQRNQYPKVNLTKRDQATVLHSEDCLKLLDYVQAIGKTGQPKIICIASRISNNRISGTINANSPIDIHW